MIQGIIEEGNWQGLRRNGPLWRSAGPLQFRAHTLFVLNDRGQVTLFLLVSSLIIPASQHWAPRPALPHPRQSTDPQSWQSCFLSGPWIIPSSLSTLLYCTSRFQERPWLEIASQTVSPPPVLCPTNLFCNSAARTTPRELATPLRETTALPALAWRTQPSLTGSRPTLHVHPQHVPPGAVFSAAQALPHTIRWPPSSFPLLRCPSFRRELLHSLCSQPYHTRYLLSLSSPLSPLPSLSLSTSLTPPFEDEFPKDLLGFSLDWGTQYISIS